VSWSKIRYFCIIYAVGNINVFNMFVLKGMILNGYEWFRLRILVMSWSWNSFGFKFMKFFMWFYVIEPFKFFSMRWTVLKCPKNSQSDGKFWNFLVRKTILGRIGVASERGSLIRNVSREHFVEHAVFNSIPILDLFKFFL